MEDLSSYRRRIGLFASVAHRKHLSRRKVQRPHKSKSPTKRKKRLTKSPNKKHICTNKEQRQQKRPCRLALLFLLIILSVTCLWKKQSSSKFNPNGNISVMNTEIYFILNIQGHSINNSFVIQPETKLQFKSYVYKEDWDYNSALTTDTDNINIVYNLNETSCMVIYPYLKDPMFDVFSCIKCPKTVGKDNLDNSRSSNERQFKNNCTDRSFVHISILLLLGTCCYLLGNKGVHCYNGNPPKKSGDAVLTEKSLSLIKQHTDESVGYISLKTELPYDSDTEKTYTNTGTGFRAGNKYFITAYHVFREKIDAILDDICFTLKNDDLKPVYKQLAQKLGTEEENKQISTRVTQEMIKRFVKQTGTNIPLLLNVLKSVIDTETINRGLTEKWKKKCLVNFIKHGSFYVDWKIAFGDEDSDIVIVKLVETELGQTFPRPLLLDENFRQLEEITIVRYINDETPKVIIDQDTEVFKDDNDLREQVRYAVELWEEKFPEEKANYFKDAYASCSKCYDLTTGRVVFKASKTFQHGASGSPIVYLFNKDGPPVVVMIYQIGLPEFYYHAELKSCNNKHMRAKDAQIDHSKCLFEGGTTMKKLSEVMTRTGQLELKSDIFSPPEKLKTDMPTGEGTVTFFKV